MDPRLTSLERAFILAGSGKYGSISELKKRLNAEGYSGDQIMGTQLSRQLEALMDSSGGKAARLLRPKKTPRPRHTPHAGNTDR